MQLAENENACGNRSRQLVGKCLADIRERVCDEVLSTLSQSPPRLQDLWKSYAIVKSARQVCTKLLHIQYEGKAPKMGSAVKTVSPRWHSNLGEDTGPLYPQIVRDTRPRVVTKLFSSDEGVACLLYTSPSPRD